VCAVTRTRLIVDWHNYGFSIMQVNGSSKFFVTIARWYELNVGRMGYRHLTVSQAMKTNLCQITRIN
jgi:beta-1,4-mannosyltransferase